MALNEIVVFAFCALTLWTPSRAFSPGRPSSRPPAMNMPNWIFYAPPLIGILLLAVVSAARLAALARGKPVEDGTGRAP